ncbi:hypothetical protein AAVH_43565, partial [Aphelenchoides avenae]
MEEVQALQRRLHHEDRICRAQGMHDPLHRRGLHVVIRCVRRIDSSREACSQDKAERIPFLPDGGVQVHVEERGGLARSRWSDAQE